MAPLITPIPMRTIVGFGGGDGDAVVDMLLAQVRDASEPATAAV
jgi:hypothetical protein